MRNHRDRAQLTQIQAQARQGALSRSSTLFARRKSRPFPNQSLPSLPTPPPSPPQSVPYNPDYLQTHRASAAAHHELVAAAAAQGTRACPAPRPAILAAPGVSTDGSVCPSINSSCPFVLTSDTLQIPSDHTPTPTSTCEAATAGACVRGASASASRAPSPATAASSLSEHLSNDNEDGILLASLSNDRRGHSDCTGLPQPGTLGFFMETITTIMTSLHNFPFFSLSIYHQFSTHFQTSGQSQALISSLPKLVCSRPSALDFQSLQSLRHHPAFLSRALPRPDHSSATMQTSQPLARHPLRGRHSPSRRHPAIGSLTVLSLSRWYSLSPSLQLSSRHLGFVPDA